MRPNPKRRKLGLVKTLRVILIAYTAVMLLIHVTSWKLLREWAAPGDSRLKRRFSARAALWVEAVYWAFLVASWRFWPSPAWKAIVVFFAVIHIAVWLAGEAETKRHGASSPPPAKARRYIVGFDLVEAVALIAIAWVTAVRIG